MENHDKVIWILVCLALPLPSLVKVISTMRYVLQHINLPQAAHWYHVFSNVLWNIQSPQTLRSAVLPWCQILIVTAALLAKIALPAWCDPTLCY